MAHAYEGGHDDGFLVVVSSLGSSSRKPFLETVSKHYRTWLFIGGAGRTSKPTWERSFIAGHTTVDTLDPQAMLAAAEELA